MYRPKRHWEEFKKLWAKRHVVTKPHPIYSGRTYAERSKQHLWYLPGPIAVFVNVVSGALTLSKIDYDLSKPEAVHFLSLSGMLLGWVNDNEKLTIGKGWLDYWWFLPVAGDSGRNSNALKSLNLTRSPFSDLAKRLFVDGYIGPTSYVVFSEEAEELDEAYNSGTLDFEGTLVGRIPPELWNKEDNDNLRLLFKAKYRSVIN